MNQSVGKSDSQSYSNKREVETCAKRNTLPTNDKYEYIVLCCLFTRDSGVKGRDCDSINGWIQTATIIRMYSCGIRVCMYL